MFTGHTTMAQSVWTLIFHLVLVSSISSFSSKAYAVNADLALAQRLENIRRGNRLNRAIGVMVKDLQSGKILYSHNPEKKFVPASSMKLIVMGASLHYLGPSYRFETRFLVDAPVRQGVIDGNLYVEGSGDPSITHHEMDHIMRSLSAAGIREISGNLILDDTFFDGRRRGPASYDNILKKGLPIQSALSYNFNRVELTATPNSKGKGRAVLHDSGYGYFTVVNRVNTSSKGKSWLRVKKLARKRIIIRGRVGLGEKKNSIESFIAPDPTEYFGSALVGKMREVGIIFGGEVLRGGHDADLVTTLYIHRSDRLVAILASMGKYSNNFSAEQILKVLGAHRWGVPGSFESGTLAVAEYLIGLGFRKTDFQIHDGSGLSYDNFVSTRILVRVLQEIHRTPEMRVDTICALSIAGVDGTLRRRFRDERYMGRVIAKTGSLSGVSSLSGYAFPENRGPIAFSVITNGIRGQWQADRVEDLVAKAILEY